jgi:hypothetical protein
MFNGNSSTGRFTVQDRGGHGSLTVAETSVAGAHICVLEYLKSLFFKPGAEEAGKATIVHTAAAHSHFINSGLLASGCSSRYEALGNTCVELRSNLLLGHATPKIIHNRPPEIANLQHSWSIGGRFGITQLR